jgi:Transposase DDE domain/SWIM zinc finger
MHPTDITEQILAKISTTAVAATPPNSISQIGIHLSTGGDMTLTETRAAFIAATKTIKFVGPHYCVPSESGNDTYDVILGEPSTCTCEHFQTTRNDCKHIVAAWMVMHRDCLGTPIETVVDEVPKKPTFKRDWPLYNEAQMTEEPRMLELLHQLVRGIEDPPSRAGRRPHPLRDRVFCCVLKVFSNFGARRFSDRLKEAHKKGFVHAPKHSGSVWSFMEDASMTPILQKLIEVSALPLRGLETVFAVDASVFLSNWREQERNPSSPIVITEPAPYAGVKAHAIVGVNTHVAVEVIIDTKMSGDAPKFTSLVQQARDAGFNLQEVCADKAYLSRENLAFVEGLGGATAYIPLKSNTIPGDEDSAWSRLFHRVALDRQKFLDHYHQRSNVEAVFSAVKRKYGFKVRSRTPVAMANEVLCKFLCQNIWAVHHAIVTLGLDAEFWSDNDSPAAGGLDTEGPTILQMRPCFA